MGSPSGTSTGRDWGKIGGIATIIGVVVAVIAIFAPMYLTPGGSKDQQPGAQGGGTTPTLIGDPPPAAGGAVATSQPATTTTMPTVVAEPGPDPNKIGEFEVISQNQTKMVGDRQFLAMPGTRSGFVFDVKGTDGYDIPECTITAKLTFVGTGSTEPMLGPANCPSRRAGIVTQNAVQARPVQGDSKRVCSGYWRNGSEGIRLFGSG